VKAKWTQIIIIWSLVAVETAVIVFGFSDRIQNVEVFSTKESL
jgi:hypothetical protein